MTSPQMVPMLSPDGQVGDVPLSRAHEAVAAGFTIAQDMISPDGKHGVIPLDRVHEAIGAGFQLSGAPPKLPPVGGVSEGTPKSGRAGKALVPSMGGPPMLMDVPEGEEVATEQTAQEGYQTGAKIGLASLMAGSAGARLGASTITKAPGGRDAAGRMLPWIQKEGPSLLRQGAGLAGDAAKSALKWMTAHPIESYVLYKIANSVGIHPGKLLHLTASAGDGEE